MSEEKIAYLRAMADRIRRTAVEMTFEAGRHGSHFGGSLSSVEIYTVLYGAVLRFPKDRARWDERDRMVAGKEHGRLSEFPAMAEAGLISKDDLASWAADDGLLAGHPLRPDIGLEYSCCSLGMAMPVAVGMALDAKRRGRQHRVYTLVGDGEMDEGLVWEGILSAAQFKLDNLTVIVDRNGLSSDGDTEQIMGLENLEAKFRAFGWDCVTVDGHDIASLLSAFEPRPQNGRPYAVIAKTVKGKGVSFAENNPAWHRGVLTEQLYKQAMADLQGEVK